MNSGLRIAACFLILVFGAIAQEREHVEGAPKEAEASEKHMPNEDAWKWANFAILAVVLGYMMSKALPPFFASRTAGIQKGIAEAAALRAESEKRVADIERRLANLDTEIQQIRAEAAASTAREGERLSKETATTMARIQAQGEQEIAAITKRATQELKAHSAELALDLAEQRIRGRMSPSTQGALVAQFMRQLEDRHLGDRA